MVPSLHPPAGGHPPFPASVLPSFPPSPALFARGLGVLPSLLPSSILRSSLVRTSTRKHPTIYSRLTHRRGFYAHKIIGILYVTCLPRSSANDELEGATLVAVEVRPTRIDRRPTTNIGRAFTSPPYLSWRANYRRLGSTNPY